MMPVVSLEGKLRGLKSELDAELINILDYWMKHTPDKVNGGFTGRISEFGDIIPESPKGAVLNARILWSFAAAYNLRHVPEYLQHAEWAYEYIAGHFIDQKHGGIYWSVDYKGRPLDTKKQVYASAFTIYGLSEYYVASGNTAAKDLAVGLYHILIDKSYDIIQTGYFEAFTCDWQPIGDLRLSAKDANEKKTMNTHLHILEAYTNLYRIWPDKGLKQKITTLLHNFLDHFINEETGHLTLFFDENWSSSYSLVSYGHDIEATWLLQEAAEVIADMGLLNRIKEVNITIAEATIKGIDTDGGLWYEHEPADDHTIKEKHWWVQAENMVGFYNAWQISGNDKYLAIAVKTWNFVKNKILDKQHGEWLWGINDDETPMKGEDKVGLWKCPYHNTRACIEIIKRIDNRML